MSLSVHATPPTQVDQRLRQEGWCAVDAAGLRTLAGLAPGRLEAWLPLWDELPPDTHLRDGGRYRRRRHGSFIVEPLGAAAVREASGGSAADDAREVRLAPHRAHWQPLEYNALHGGIERWFEPLPAPLLADPAWAQLLRALARVADGLRGAQRWFVEAHPFRIDTAGGIGRPTPEGAHRDGVDLVAVLLVQRQGIKGGETRVFDAEGPRGVRFTLTEPFSALLLDDDRVIHESTPIQPLAPEGQGFRDTLVLTYRAGGFQGPQPAAAPSNT